jgi:hypothetical protein
MIIMMPVPNSKHEESRALGAVADSGLIQLSEGDIFILPPSFVPGKWDVICQRGKECFEHGKQKCGMWCSCWDVMQGIFLMLQVLLCFCSGKPPVSYHY